MYLPLSNLLSRRLHVTFDSTFPWEMSRTKLYQGPVEVLLEIMSQIKYKHVALNNYFPHVHNGTFT